MYKYPPLNTIFNGIRVNNEAWWGDKSSILGLQSGFMLIWNSWNRFTTVGSLMELLTQGSPGELMASALTQLLSGWKLRKALSSDTLLVLSFVQHTSSSVHRSSRPCETQTLGLGNFGWDGFSILARTTCSSKHSSVNKRKLAKAFHEMVSIMWIAKQLNRYNMNNWFFIICKCYLSKDLGWNVFTFLVMHNKCNFFKDLGWIVFTFLVMHNKCNLSKDFGSNVFTFLVKHYLASLPDALRRCSQGEMEGFL